MATCSMVAIANGRMRLLKAMCADNPRLSAHGCNSEWPYEVTERHYHPHHRDRRTRVAIANGRMRSLKAASTSPPPPPTTRCNSEWPYEVTESACRTSGDLGRRRCNSEWPYEVTERLIDPYRQRSNSVAIANGRMRSLKVFVGMPLGRRCPKLQ